MVHCDQVIVGETNQPDLKFT